MQYDDDEPSAEDREALDRFPDRVYVKNETGDPHATDVYDADSGKRFEGVMDVDVHVDHGHTEIDVEATRHWPIGKADHVVQDPGYDGPERQGIKTIHKVYSVKKLEVESQ